METTERKGLTLSGLSGMHLLHMLNAILMFAAGAYLLNHYYITLFPTELGGSKTLCDVSSFWNCDVTTYSPVSSIAGVPIAFFGMLNGLFLLSISFFPSESQERTASAFTKYNLIGCAVLFTYSLVALGGLCPVCTAYYVFSAIAAVLYWKKGINTWSPDLKVVGIWGAIVLAGAVGMGMYSKSKVDRQADLAGQVIEQYKGLTTYGDPDTDSPYIIHKTTEKFADAPLRVSIFSDFQCPFCKVVAEQMPSLVRRYGDRLNIQYFFYPLDSSCNASVKSAMHIYACKAAQLAACDPSKFAKVHDEIFAAQEGMDLDVLQKIAKDNGVEECFSADKTRDQVVASINSSAKFNIRSTPTIIVNGKKIEGTIPSPQFFAIFEELLKK